MIQTIFFLSSVYISSSNRLLLQTNWVAPKLPTNLPEPIEPYPGNNPNPGNNNPNPGNNNPSNPVAPSLPAQIVSNGDPSRIPIFPQYQPQTPEPIQQQQPQYPYAAIPSQNQPQYPQYPNQPQQPQVIPYANTPQNNYQYNPNNPGRSTPWVAPALPTQIPNQGQPQYTPIYNPGLPYDPINNPYGYQNHPQPNTTPFPQGMSDMFCPTVNSCANRHMVLFNPSDTFRWTCEVSGSCAGASLSIAMNHMSASVEMFEGIFCKGGEQITAQGIIPGSCEGITFMMDNKQLGGHAVEIEKFECSGPNACRNAQIILGPNVKILNILCDYGQCDGCKLKMYPNDIGTDCVTAGLMGDPFPL